MADYIYLLYTHSSYIDVLNIHLNELKKHYDLNIIVATDNKELLNPYKNGYNIIDIIEYDNALTYPSRLSYILGKLDYKYMLFTHDNNIPVNTIHSDILNTLVANMESYDIDQIRLFVSGINEPLYTDDILYKKCNSGSYQMSVQSALWKRSSLMDICDKFPTHNYRTIECNEVQEYVSHLKNYYLSSSKDTLIKGHGHVLSYYFPIIHSTTNGKWSIDSDVNSKYINQFVKEYNLDLNIRGIA